MEALREELESSLDTTLAVQEMRTKREEELQTLKRSLDQAQKSHDEGMADTKQKFTQQLEQATEELENVKKVGGFITQTHKIEAVLDSCVKHDENRVKFLQTFKKD